MSYKLAIVGGRDFDDRSAMLEELTEFFREHGKPLCIVSGGAIGADRMGVEMGREFGLCDPIEHLPDYPKYGSKQAPLERNKLIAQDCDMMIAFPTPKSRGTWNAINNARKLGKPVKVVERPYLH